MALIGMKVHLPIGQCADQLPIFANVGNQHDGRILCREPWGMAHGGRPKSLAEPDLIVFAEMLIAEEDDEAVVPSIEDFRKYLIARRPAQIDADNFCADAGSKRPRLELIGG